MLARNGCDVTVVDIEEAYVEGIQRQCRALNIPIRACVGEFGFVPEAGERFDAVLFFETFHHALRHNELLRQLQRVVADDGLIAFAGEPIIAPGDVWEPTVPFPWGPRCDLLSLWAMRTQGWMELGFREAYFLEALSRAGWSAVKHACSLTSRGNTYIARRTSA
jgi:SAM-dependent methyltransferase